MMYWILTHPPAGLVTYEHLVFKVQGLYMTMVHQHTILLVFYEQKKYSREQVGGRHL